MNLIDIKTYYINLENRTDRKDHVENELSLLGIKNFERVNAVKLQNGALGCSISHLKCIEQAKERKEECIFVCEDDILFLDKILLLTYFSSFIKKSHEWDVIIISGNNMLPYHPIDETCIQVMACQTTTGYIVKNHYYDTLINNYKKGIQLLMKFPENKKEYAIDKYWLELQKKDKWYLIIPLSVVQREDYSDIEQKKIDFRSYMLNYNKCYK